MSAPCLTIRRPGLPGSLLCALLLALGMPAAGATLHKCQISGGQIEYRNKPCESGRKALPMSADDRLSIISGESFRRREAPSQDKRPGWVKELAPDPIGACKARGGVIDRELRACMIP